MTSIIPALSVSTTSIICALQGSVRKELKAAASVSFVTSMEDPSEFDNT